MLNTYLSIDCLSYLRVEAYKLWAKILPSNPSSSFCLVVCLVCFELFLAAIPSVQNVFGPGRLHILPWILSFHFPPSAIHNSKLNIQRHSQWQVEYPSQVSAVKQLHYARHGTSCFMYNISLNFHICPWRAVTVLPFYRLWHWNSVIVRTCLHSYCPWVTECGLNIGFMPQLTVKTISLLLCVLMTHSVDLLKCLSLFCRNALTQQQKEKQLTLKNEQRTEKDTSKIKVCKLTLSTWKDNQHY